MPADRFRFRGPVLAEYASRPEASRGRLHQEPEAEERTPHERDRDRILHSGAFRKLRNKTQVFMFSEGDYFRTRLTHSLEVAQITRSLCRSLGLNEDLGEALALAHDFGHTPFGHAGEHALDTALEPYGGFDHNDQTLRLVTCLEQRYAAFDGLNLTWECLEGLIKHNGPVPGTPSRTVAELALRINLDLRNQASAEAQVASVADDIAYDAHDIEDGLRAGLFDVEVLSAVPLASAIVDAILSQYGKLESGRMAHEIYRHVTDMLCRDLLAETRRRLAALRPDSAEAVRAATGPLVGFSDAVREADAVLKTFLHNHMYRHYKVNRMAIKASRVVSELFELLAERPYCLPGEWQIEDRLGTPEDRALLIADYIAGMTDRYALLEHRRLFDLETIR